VVDKLIAHRSPLLRARVASGVRAERGKREKTPPTRDACSRQAG